MSASAVVDTQRPKSKRERNTRVHGFKLFANKADLDECDFTSHSLRQGGATYLVICGATIEEIKVRGDCVREVVNAYLKTPVQVQIMKDLRFATSLAQV